MLEKVEAKVDKIPIGEWDAIFQEYLGVHREDDTCDRRILNTLLAKKDHGPQYSDVTHHELPATLVLAQFILPVINKSLDDSTSSATLPMWLLPGANGKVCIAVWIRSDRAGAL